VARGGDKPFLRRSGTSRDRRDLPLVLLELGADDGLEEIVAGDLPMEMRMVLPFQGGDS
jgi:hypothetical protein